MSLKALFEQSMQLISSNQLQAAEDFIFDILEKHPQWPVAHSLMGIVQIRKQQPENAEVAFFKALSLEPQNPEYWQNYLKSLPPEKALTFCLENIDKIPAHMELIQNCINLVLKNGQAGQEIPLLFLAALHNPTQNDAPMILKYLLTHPQKIHQSFSLLPPQHAQRVLLFDMILMKYLNQQMLVQALEFGQQEIHNSQAFQSWKTFGIVQREWAFQHAQPENWEAALDSFKQALKFDSKDLELHFFIAQCLLALSQPENAYPYFQTCVSLEAAQIQIEQTANELYSQESWRLAQDYYALCETFITKLKMPLDLFYSRRFDCAHFLCEYEQQKQFELKITELGNKLKYEVNSLCQFPYVYESLAHLKTVRQNFIRKLGHLEHKIDKIIKNNAPLEEIALRPPFFLAYQGYDDFALMKRFAALCTKIIKYQNHYAECTHQPGQHKKLRIGFVSSFFHEHSVSICYGGAITTIAQKDDIDVYLFYLDSKTDATTKMLKNQVHTFIYTHLADAQKTILEAELDALIFTDIGMDGASYVLGLNRLAPIQCVFNGHPITTGLPNIDYKTSSLINRGYHETYSETTWYLRHGLSSRPTIQAPPPASREELGLETDAHIYFCPMTLQKIHPEFDDILHGILKQDSLAQIYFAYSPNEGKHIPLQKRFNSKMGNLSHRIHFRPWMSRTQLLQFIQNTDLILDSIYFGSGTTSYLIFAMNKAILTMPLNFARARVVFNLYQRMGFQPEQFPLIANSPQDYVDKAIAYVKNKNLQTEVQQNIQANKHHIFDNPTGIEHFLLYLRQALKHYPDKFSEIL